jgi:hemolysin-activating ACP:hemolysin acyltransferase
MDRSEYRIEVLSGSYEALGMVLDLLSRHPPFADWPLSRLSKSIRRQLQQGRQVGALSSSNELVAYAGWTPTLQASAELWIQDRGPLKVLERGYDAMAMTIVVSPQPGVAKALMRKARKLNPDTQWFFKRSYGHQLRESRKTALRDSAARAEDSSEA